MKAREQRADYQVSKMSTPDQPADSLTQLQVIDAIERGLHTKSDVMAVNRKRKFFRELLRDKSMVKAFILLMP